MTEEAVTGRGRATEEAGTEKAPSVDSEIGPLETVIVHRPGRELTRLTPDNRELLLFDEIPWLEGAQAEHDALVDVLRAHHVEVLYLSDLLAEVLSVPEARKEILEEACSDHRIGPALADSMAGHLDAMGDRDLAGALVGGVTFAEIARPGRSLPGLLSGPEEFALIPLVNHLFMRDSSMWIGGRPHLGSMAAPPRRRETSHLRAIYRHHPRFSHAGGASDDYPGPIEGGDVLVPGGNCLLVGVGARTSAAAVEDLARRVFAAGEAAEVIAVDLPHERAVIHLDTVMTMVDRDLFTVFPPVVEALRAYRLLPDGHGATAGERAGVRVEVDDDLPSALSAALGLPGLRLVPTGGDVLDQQREQWSDANNVFALRPGVVVAYDRNVATNEALSAAGAEVIPVPSSELGRGRGGPRCLTCPVRRRPADG